MYFNRVILIAFLQAHARSGPPINGMDQAVLDQEGDMNTFNNRI